MPTNHYVYTGKVHRKSDYWEPEYDDIEEWEIFLSRNSHSSAETFNLGSAPLANDQDLRRYTPKPLSQRVSYLISRWQTTVLLP